MFVVPDELVLERRINCRVLDKCCCGHLDDDVIDTDLQIRIEGVNAFAHLRCPVHLDLTGEKEMGHRPKRSHEAASNSSPNLGCGFVAIGRSARDSCGLKPGWFNRARITTRAWLGLSQRLLNVLLYNPSTWSTTSQGFQIQPGLCGHSSRKGRNNYATGAAHWRGLLQLSSIALGDCARSRFFDGCGWLLGRRRRLCWRFTQ